MLHVISPIDGRYAKLTEPLAKFFSEEAFMRYRILFEIKFLKAITKKSVPDLEKNFAEKDAREIKKIEATTNHDFKAIEYWMRGKLPKWLGNWLHFGLTSQDATNIAYALMITDALREVIIPSLEKILSMLYTLSTTHYALPM